MTVISYAPGKVLITGGYLVLDPNYSGCVLVTTAQFRVTVSSLEHSDKIIVDSPQFLDPQRKYTLIGKSSIALDSNSMANPFIDKSIEICAKYIQLKPCLITIEADNDFYSHAHTLEEAKLPLNRKSLGTLPRFSPLKKSINNVPKTGLGSSAALTTALVSSLLVFHGAVDSQDLEGGKESVGKMIIHNMAQICHCAAQNKVGSGFDVSSAVYGSHIYRRFEPSLVDLVIGNRENFSDMELKELVEKRWNSVVELVRLPKGFSVVLADIRAGSNTPSMVSKILNWAKENPKERKYTFLLRCRVISIDEAIWKELNENNQLIHESLTRLCELESAPTYQHSLNVASAYSMQDLLLLEHLTTNKPELSEIKAIYQSFERIRKAFRKLSVKTGAPVEPPEQTDVLDSCLKVPGVISAGVPGAGGYDAIFCIIINKPVVVDNLEKCWSDLSICGLPCECTGSGLKVVNNVKRNT